MAQDNLIDVTIYPARPTTESRVTSNNDATGEEVEVVPLEFSDVNYISFVSDETYGIPALISEPKVKDDGLPATILYVFPANIVAMEAVRRA